MDQKRFAVECLKGAKTFVSLYALLASPGMLPIANFINEWRLASIGFSLIIGFGIKVQRSVGGADDTAPLSPDSSVSLPQCRFIHCK